MLSKNAAKVKIVVVSAEPGDFLHIFLRISQQPGGLLHPQPGHIRRKCRPNVIRKKMIDIGRIHLKPAAQ